MRTKIEGDTRKAWSYVAPLLRRKKFGITRPEFRDMLVDEGLSPGKASSLRRRLSDLVVLEHLVESGERRAGAAVLKLA